MVKNQWAGWQFAKPEEDLCMLDVIKFGTIDYKTAGLLWLFMEQRASFIVAAAPVWAGKTTMMNSMLDFLKPEIEQYTLQGYYEDFKHLGDSSPENTCLVAEEISNHQYEYLWGFQVVKAFQQVKKGYALGTTTHARDIREVAYILNALGVEPDMIAKLGVVVTMQVARDKSREDGYIRYVDTVSSLSVTDDGLVAYMLASRDQPAEKLQYPAEDVLQSVFTNKYGKKFDSITAEMEKRGEILAALDIRQATRRELLKAIGDFYRGKEG
jgi:hypothetical protein